MGLPLSGVYQKQIPDPALAFFLDHEMPHLIEFHSRRLGQAPAEP